MFDLFRVRYLNLLKNAKSMCEKLIVDVTTDELVLHKYKKIVISFEERMETIRNIKFVNVVVSQETMDKFEMWKRFKFDVMLVDDSLYGLQKWNKSSLKKEISEIDTVIMIDNIES